jgi:nucleoside-diphosphate-sugar epimerase
MVAARVTLVTGFPNFRARHVVAQILGSSLDGVWAVVAPKDIAFAEEWRAELPLRQRTRLRLLTGEPWAIDMGLSGSEYRELIQAVDCIQHLAQTSGTAAERRGGEPCEVVNIGGMREALELARACTQLQSLVVHSSVLVSGDREGVVLESELAAGQDFPGPDSATLARAELMARRRMPQLPIVVVRSGPVVGASGNGRADGLEGVYLLILLILNAPQELSALLSRSGDAPLHVVPVDYLAQAAEALSRNPDALGQTVHLTDPNPMSVRMAFEQCVTLRARLSDAGVALPAAGSVLRRDSLLRDSLQSIVWRPRAFINTTFREVRYRTESAERLLRDAGLVCPPLESYLEQLVRHVAHTIAHPPAAAKAS